MSANREQASALFAAGNRDRTSFLLLLESGRAPHETMGFLAQQACEKFIKAVLVLNGVQFERTHDLEWLWDRAALSGVAVPIDKAELRSLNPYMRLRCAMKGRM
jgi:HEPN domain-containing protein